MLEHYILDEDGVLVLEPDIIKCVIWFAKNKNTVARTMIGNVKVSTVFLSINHAFDEGIPLLFETMIFGGTHDNYQSRYATRTGALDGHAEAVALVKEHALNDT